MQLLEDPQLQCPGALPMWASKGPSILSSSIVGTPVYGHPHVQCSWLLLIQEIPKNLGPNLGLNIDPSSAALITRTPTKDPHNL